MTEAPTRRREREFIYNNPRYPQRGSARIFNVGQWRMRVTNIVCVPRRLESKQAAKIQPFSRDQARFPSERGSFLSLLTMHGE